MLSVAGGADCPEWPTVQGAVSLIVRADLVLQATNVLRDTRDSGRGSSALALPSRAVAKLRSPRKVACTVPTLLCRIVEVLLPVRCGCRLPAVLGQSGDFIRVPGSVGTFCTCLSDLHCAGAWMISFVGQGLFEQVRRQSTVRPDCR